MESVASPPKWNLVFGRPSASIRHCIIRYCGYSDETPVTPEQRQLPSGVIPMIINLGPAILVHHPAKVSTRVGTGSGFVGGLHDIHVLTQALGTQAGIQVDFTPMGAYLFLGRPMNELTNQVVAFDDLFGLFGTRLIERLAETVDWTDRFALLDAWIARRVARAKPVSAVVAYSWGQLAACNGCLEIADLATDFGCSQKHLIARFREEIGLPPKRTARILRFDRAIHLLNRKSPESWASLAIECGYYDQAHLIQDFRRFSGMTPGDYVRQIAQGSILPMVLPSENDTMQAWPQNLDTALFR